MEEKEYVLIVSSGDWADEFDLEGFAIFEKEKWEHIKEGIPEGEFEASFGSNEIVTFEDRDDYLSHLKEKPITAEEIKFLCKLLNLREIQPENEYLNNITYGLFVINSENY